MSPRDEKGHGSNDKNPDRRKLAEELRDAMGTDEWRSMDKAADAYTNRQQSGKPGSSGWLT